MPTIHSNQSESDLHTRMPRVAGYTLLEPLHEGSCGMIYRARQDRLGRIVALKLLPEWPPPMDVQLERFNRASYVNAQSPHPNLLTLYDTGTKDGFHFVSLEFVNGQTLQQHLSDIGPGGERSSLHVAVQILRALAALHARDICHRNLKPKNIFLETNGNVRVIGLGLASCKSAFFSPHLDARPIGTPHFMAPEMIKGSYADPRSDLYSLGVTLYVAVTGCTPFEKGSPLAVMSRHLTDSPIPLDRYRPGLSPEFVNFVNTLMMREPENRYQSAKAALEVAEALYKRYTGEPKRLPELLAESGVITPPRSRASGWWTNRPLAVAGLSVAATVMLVGGLWGAIMWMQDREAAPPAVEAPAAPPSPAATPKPQIETDGVESVEFTKLLEMDDRFRNAPDAGADGWAGYLQKFPNASAARRKIARSRLDMYLNLEQRRGERERERAEPKRELPLEF